MKIKHKPILIIAILFLSGMTINTSYASKPAAEKALGTKNMQNLAPVIPVEADFNDMPSEMASVLNLVPITPVLADFEDASDEITVDFTALAPVTPAEADFE